MTPLFADTFYFQARVNSQDQHHARVLAWSQKHTAPLVTTDLVLVELANSLAGSRFRPLVQDYFALLRRHATVVPNSRARFEQALKLYHQHDDKLWSLTDCLSFVVMRERGLTVALTGDRHFVQAGFAAVFA
ncbi:MAG: type II toxin-antitoxin system VapC family toxin [Opitutaceae bacterium]|nr:type II toxin-antitoxin system VapC family toxin [Opitutaceae bacterium]